MILPTSCEDERAGRGASDRSGIGENGHLLFGDHVRLADKAAFDATLLWFGDPQLPTDYPETASDLRVLAAAIDGDAVAVLAAFGVPDWDIAPNNDPPKKLDNHCTY